MPILVRKDIRILSSREVLSAFFEVVSIDLYVRQDHQGAVVNALELFVLEDGSRKRADELIFIEVDEDQLTALRLEASILAKEGSGDRRRAR